MERWTECVEIFKDFDLVSSSDIGHLARYCKMYSEYRDLVERRATIANVDGVTLRDEHKAGEKLEIEMGEKAAAQLFKKIDYILSTSGVLEIDSAINKKADQLTKMEDRLFLNPQAKIKTQAQKKKPDKNNPLEDAGFGGI
jgi:phage terminase small subunit